MRLSVFCTLVILGFACCLFNNADAKRTPKPSATVVARTRKPRSLPDSTEKSVNAATPTSVPTKRPTLSKHAGTTDSWSLIEVEETFYPPWIPLNNPFPWKPLPRLWRREATNKPPKGGNGKPSFKDLDQPAW
ncbi:uncharacterized protein [Diabrotica undecimpunctata]|uniref:uncharacterized protein n=1 Tax=Diabrotica undecimpunctata TaxID=50387 RepID=UPI003B63C8EB